MTDCEHCSETFADEAGYLRHLDSEHPDEMGPIERRKLDELGGSGGDGVPTPLLVGAMAVGALLVTIVVYTLTMGGGAGANSELGELGPAPSPNDFDLGPAGDDETYRPYGTASVHEHGQISVNVAGNQIDFTQPKFQHPRESRNFHFEAGERRWHGHAKGITLEYALETTAFGVTNTSFAYDGVVYREGSNASAPDGWEVVTNATVTYTVNGEAVAPETYVLQDGDTIVVEVQRPDSGGNESTTNGTAANASGLA